MVRATHWGISALSSAAYCLVSSVRLISIANRTNSAKLDAPIFSMTQARYDEAHFRAHRENTTKGAAHRRFAVSVNLNDDLDGGEVCFPHYGPCSYKAPAGGAFVFSCSLLHAVSEVNRGRRFAYLPFLCDDEAARLREVNFKFLEAGKANYKNGLVVLRHELLFLILPDFDAMQQGHRDSALATPTIS